MITYKLLGAGGIFVSGIWLFLIRESYQKKKMLQLQGYIRLISHIKNQISCYMLPIDKILQDCDERILQDCGFYASSPAESIEAILDGSVFFFDDEIQQKLYLFARDFGKGYLNEQIKLCDRYISELKSIYEHFNAERTKDKKLSFAICLSISLSLILILL